jgi:hypothetical protein
MSAKHRKPVRCVLPVERMDLSDLITSARSLSESRWTRKKFASWGRKANCRARSSPPRAQKRRVWRAQVQYRSGAPRSMKMGTTAPPWRYDAVVLHTLQEAGQHAGEGCVRIGAHVGAGFKPAPTASIHAQRPAPTPPLPAFARLRLFSGRRIFRHRLHVESRRALR